MAEQIEERDGRFTDTTVLDYVRSVAGRVAKAAGMKPLEIGMTNSSRQYAALLPNGVLLISSGLVLRTESEAELAGVLAHEQAHRIHPVLLHPAEASSTIARFGACVLASDAVPVHWAEITRAAEVDANTIAVRWLEAAGYDPQAMLDILSKLAYENPGWPKALLPEDLAAARAVLDREPLPPGGYIVDTSVFGNSHRLLEDPAVVVHLGPELRRVH